MSPWLLAALLAAAPQAAQDVSPAVAADATPSVNSTPSATTQPVSLAQARAEGRKNTQALLALLDLERAQLDVHLARSPLLPQLGFSTSAGGAVIGRQRIFTTIPNSTGDGFVQEAVEVPRATRGNYDISFNLSQVIYDRARWKQLEQSGVIADASKSQSVEQADAAELEAIARFFTLYRTQATIRVLEATVQRSESQLERARALFQAGRVGRGEELSALVNLGNDRINLVQRRAQLVQDQGQLAVWLARPGTAPIAAEDPGVLTAEPAPAPALEPTLVEARERRPLLRALHQQVRVAELSGEIAGSGYYPTLGANGSYSRGGSQAGAVFTEPRLQNTVSGNVVLQWQLFSGLSTSAEVSKARASQRTAELNLAQAERELEASLRAAVELLATRIDAARLSAENRESAAQSLALAEERFKAGAGSTLEVRDAQLSLTQAELTLLGNRVDVEIARYSLMRAMGTLSPGETQ